MKIDLTKTNIKNNIRPWVNNTLRQDLFTLKDHFAANCEKPIEGIANESMIPESVLEKIEHGNQLVADTTIYRFYKYFFSKVDSNLLGIRHEWIRLKFLSEKLKRDGELEHDIELALESSMTLRKLYLQSRLHNVCVDNAIKSYGEEGKMAIDVLERYELIELDDETESYKSTKKFISKRPSLLKKLMEDAVCLGINTEKLWGLGDNTCFYGLEWVSEDSYEKIILIMDKAKEEIRSCIKESHNDAEIPLLVIGVVDKFKCSTLED
jgi:hypothetical protein